MIEEEEPKTLILIHLHEGMLLPYFLYYIQNCLIIQSNRNYKFV